jgi:PAS domain S-box-containing protein
MLERKETAADTLRESEEKFRVVFDEAAEGIVLMPVDGSLLWVNQTFARMHGYECPEEMQDLRLGDLDTPGTAAMAPERLQRLLAGEVLEFDAEHYRKDGSTFVLHVSCKVAGIDGERFFLGLHQDITDRKRAEEAVKESERRLRALSDNLPGGLVYQIDSGRDGTERRFTYVSAGVERLHGISVAMAMEDPMRIYGQIHPEDVSMVAARERQALETMSPLVAEVRVLLPSGRTAWRLFTSAPRRLADGCVIWDGIETDITDRKRAEEEREKLREQLLQSQKMESVGRLAGGIAHDFNNMLSVILGHTEMLIDRLKPDDPLLDDLRTISTAAERSADLTRQLLAFARKQTVAPRVLDLNATVAEMIDMLQRLIGEDIELAWMPGADAGLVRMDPSQIDQVLANLCVNARDAIADTGEITIETGFATFDDARCATHHDCQKGDYSLLAVSDSGCGMDAATVAHLFEPFFTTKDRGKGTGLGLATVYGIVRQNNGFIQVHSEPGHGTTFRIHLPRCAEEMAAVPEKKEAAGATKSGGETVLLVEDEPMILDITCRMLDLLGYRTVIAATPGEAIRLAREHAGRIDLLMTDVVMPEMNGRELARNLLSLYPDLKRLFMSGYTADVIAHHGVLDPGVHFLQKPFSMNALAHKLREALAD